MLGVYLGDGWLSSHRGKAHRFRVSLDARYPGIIQEVAAAMRAEMPGHAVDVRHRHGDGCVVVSCYGRRWFDLFPQHGVGRKHDRSIELEPWQRVHTLAHPKAFVRGLLQTDGSRYIAHVTSRGRPYAYVRYSFSNRSDDIKRLLCEHLDILGIRWSRPNAWQIAVARKTSVAILDTFVGPKR